MVSRRSYHSVPIKTLLLLTLAALGVRLLALGSKSLLVDEATSYYFSQLPLGTLFFGLCDPHPPGYYLLLRWVSAAGASEWWLRLPSALAGALAVPLTWLVAQQAIRPTVAGDARWPDRAALLSAGLVAVTPLHVWYSQEARPYALLSLLALALAWAGLRWWLQPSLAGAGLFLLLGWLALSVEYGALIVVFGLSLWMVSGWPWRPATDSRGEGEAGGQGAAPGRPGIDPGQKARRWAALQAVLLAPLLGWWLTPSQAALWSGSFYQAVLLAVQAQAVGVDITPTQASRLIAWALLVAAMAWVVFSMAVRRSRRLRGWLGGPLVACMLVGLVMVMAIAGVAPRLYTVKRHLAVLMPFLSIAAAWALAHQWQARVWLRIVTAGVLSAMIGLSLVAVVLIPKPPWREAAARLALEVAAGDSVWIDEMDAPVFDYYWGERMPWRILHAKDLAALEAVPAGQRLWLMGATSPYRDLNQTLPASFLRRRAASRQADWPGVALRAYDARSVPLAETGTGPMPSQALLWGLDLLSPMDTRCR